MKNRGKRNCGKYQNSKQAREEKVARTEKEKTAILEARNATSTGREEDDDD